VLILGGFYMLIARPYERGHAPAGDAHRLDPREPPPDVQVPIG
jgi:hypothetical protein